MRPFTAMHIAAIALADGGLVYLTEDDSWTRQPSEAELIEDEAHGQLRLLTAQAQARSGRRPIAAPRLAEARTAAAA